MGIEPWAFICSTCTAALGAVSLAISDTFVLGSLPWKACALPLSCIPDSPRALFFVLHPAVLRASSWFSTWGSLLVVGGVQGPEGVPGLNLGQVYARQVPYLVYNLQGPLTTRYFYLPMNKRFFCLFSLNHDLFPKLPPLDSFSALHTVISKRKIRDTSVFCPECSSQG